MPSEVCDAFADGVLFSDRFRFPVAPLSEVEPSVEVERPEDPEDSVSDEPEPACGCASGAGAAPWWGLAGLVGLVRRRQG